MDTILFLAFTESDGSLAKPALEALGAAVAMGVPLTVGLIGASVAGAASQVANCGAARFLGVSGEEFGQSRYATDAAAAEAVARAAGATIVIAAASVRANRALPGVAHRLNGAIDTHVTSVAGGPSISRWYYRQRMEAAVSRTARPWFILLESGCRAAWTGKPGEASVESVAVTLPPLRTTVTGVRSPQSGVETIRPDARLLFVAGAGWTKKQADGQPHPREAEELILGFLAKTQASLGGSKSLVDLSGEGEAVLPFMTHLNQIGQTGASPRHPKGLSTCCHGEEPHVVGWRFVTERRAVNLDANCGWARGKADVLYVADAFEVMRKVNALLG
ncbi:MAG: electron transfer flavoprotein subunit alpha [Bryobacteraceae bacterium]|jgi:electron transfer flavoprotein alpha subunit